VAFVTSKFSEVASDRSKPSNRLQCISEAEKHQIVYITSNLLCLFARLGLAPSKLKLDTYIPFYISFILCLLNAVKNPNVRWLKLWSLISQFPLFPWPSSISQRVLVDMLNRIYYKHPLLAHLTPS